MAFDNEDESASLEVKAQKALEFRCILNLMKSTAEVLKRGSDCVQPFVALQKCIQPNPDAFPKEVLENNEVEIQEKLVDDYKIIPPRWSVESTGPKHKL